MNSIQIVGFIAGIFTGISLLPQLFKIIREKETEDISLWMLLVLLAGLALWTIYGVLINDLPIIITNSFSIIINIIILFFRFRYKKGDQKKIVIGRFKVHSLISISGMVFYINKNKFLTK